MWRHILSVAWAVNRNEKQQAADWFLCWYMSPAYHQTPVHSRDMRPCSASQRQQYSLVLWAILWNSEGILVSDCVGQGKTITRVYCTWLDKKLCSVQMLSVKNADKVLLHDDNAPAGTFIVASCDLCLWLHCEQPSYQPCHPHQLCLFTALQDLLIVQNFKNLKCCFGQKCWWKILFG